MAGGLQVALDYAEALGWALTPRLPDCAGFYKNEALGFTRGCHDASSDPEVIRALFSGHEDANVSLTTGFISKVLIVDCDVGHDGACSLRGYQAQHGELPKTVMSRTPSAGFHLYFVHPDQAVRNRVGFLPGLDVRTNGGSVPLPPSYRQGRQNKPDGAYAWIRDPWTHAIADLPHPLLTLIAPPEPPVQPREPLRISGTERTARYVLAAVDGEFKAVAGCKSGGRNLRLFQAAANLGELVGAKVLPQANAEKELEAAAAKCGLVADDGIHQVRITIASGMRKGMANPREVDR